MATLIPKPLNPKSKICPFWLVVVISLRTGCIRCSYNYKSVLKRQKFTYFITYIMSFLILSLLPLIMFDPFFVCLLKSVVVSIELMACFTLYAAG